MTEVVSTTVVLRRYGSRRSRLLSAGSAPLMLLLAAGLGYGAHGLQGYAVAAAHADEPVRPVPVAEVEISDDLYRVLQSDLTDVPGLRSHINRAIADGRITHAEYAEIRALKMTADPMPSKAALRYHLDRAMGVWKAQRVL